MGTCRPDFLLYVNDILLFKGEEKAVKDDFNNAKDDLSKKFSTLDPLFFGDVKFLMCYAAAGSKLGFFAIDGFTGNLVPLTNLFDLHAPESRFMVIETIINIVPSVHQGRRQKTHPIAAEHVRMRKGLLRSCPS